MGVDTIAVQHIPDRQAHDDAPPPVPPKQFPTGAHQPRIPERSGSLVSQTDALDLRNEVVSEDQEPNARGKHATAVAQPSAVHLANESSRDTAVKEDERPASETPKLLAKLSEAEENTRNAFVELTREREKTEELNKTINDLLRYNEEYKVQTDIVRAELEETKNELRDTRSHILSLQPYVRDITPEEIGRDYDDVISRISDFVERFMTPIFDSTGASKEIYNAVRKQTLTASELRRRLRDNPDLLRASNFPDTNQDVLVGLIMRSLYQEVFSKVLFDTVDNYVQILSSLEESMKTSVEPKRDLFAIRNWRAETYNSLINHHEFAPVRDQRCMEIAVHIGKPLFFFLSAQQSSNEFYKALDFQVVRPAVALQEKIQTSIHHFYFSLNTYASPGSLTNDQARASELLDDLSSVDCEDVFNNRKKFTLEKFSKPPTRSEILHKLFPIATIRPQLCMRQVGRGEIMEEPIVVRKAQVLVAWGTASQRHDKIGGENQTLINALYYMKSETSSKSQEGSIWKGLLS